MYYIILNNTNMLLLIIFNVNLKFPYLMHLKNINKFFYVKTLKIIFIISQK